MRRRKFLRFVPAVSLKAAALAVAVGLFAPPGVETSLAQGAGPFAGMAGSWSGGGAITLASGSHERIRCRAVYEAPGGRTLAALALRERQLLFRSERQSPQRRRHLRLLERDIATISARSPAAPPAARSRRWRPAQCFWRT
jgi:hypothetical protein